MQRKMVNFDVACGSVYEHAAFHPGGSRTKKKRLLMSFISQLLLLLL